MSPSVNAQLTKKPLLLLLLTSTPFPSLPTHHTQEAALSQHKALLPKEYRVRVVAEAVLMERKIFLKRMEKYRSELGTYRAQVRRGGELCAVCLRGGLAEGAPSPSSAWRSTGRSLAPTGLR